MQASLETVLTASGLQAMRTVVEQRGQLLDETDDALETNVTNAKRSARDAGMAYRKCALM